MMCCAAGTWPVNTENGMQQNMHASMALITAQLCNSCIALLCCCISILHLSKQLWQNVFQWVDTDAGNRWGSLQWRGPAVASHTSNRAAAKMSVKLWRRHSEQQPCSMPAWLSVQAACTVSMTGDRTEHSLVAYAILNVSVVDGLHKPSAQNGSGATIYAVQPLLVVICFIILPGCCAIMLGPPVHHLCSRPDGQQSQVTDTVDQPDVLARILCGTC